MTVKDTVKTASKIGKVLAKMKEDYEITADLAGGNCNESEEAILQQAVGIIRSRSRSTVMLEQEYFSPEETNLPVRKILLTL